MLDDDSYIHCELGFDTEAGVDQPLPYGSILFLAKQRRRPAGKGEKGSYGR